MYQVLENLKVRIFPHFFQHWQSSNSGLVGRMAGLPVLKKYGKIQKVVLRSDFDIFSPEMYRLPIRLERFVVLQLTSQMLHNEC